MSPAAGCLWEMRPGAAAAGGRRTLLLLPHAGGSAQSYAAWRDWFPEDVRILAAQYPGRASRAREPAAAALDHVVEEIFNALGDLDGPLHVFGHSMGSYIGFELCWRSQLMGHAPAVFFASGAVPAHLYRPVQVPAEELSDEWLLKLLDVCNGIPAEILNHPEIMSRALRTLRADITLTDNYSYGDRRRRLAIPIIAFGGDQDALVPVGELDRWRELSTGECATHLFSGEHFYYLDNMATFTAAMSKYLVSARDEHKK